MTGERNEGSAPTVNVNENENDHVRHGPPVSIECIRLDSMVAARSLMARVSEIDECSFTANVSGHVRQGPHERLESIGGGSSGAVRSLMTGERNEGVSEGSIVSGDSIREYWSGFSCINAACQISNKESVSSLMEDRLKNCAKLAAGELNNGSRFTSAVRSEDVDPTNVW